MIDTKMHASKSSSPTPGVLMDVNADLTRRVVVDIAQIPWVPSSSGTVWRKPLFRQGGEFRPVTSLVRYAPGGVFPGALRACARGRSRVRRLAHPRGSQPAGRAGSPRRW